MNLNSYVTGFFYPSINLGTTTLNSVGGDDIFLAKLGDLNTIVQEISFTTFLSLSPNPATNEIRIQNAELRIESVEVYNVFGERLTLPFDFAQGDTRVNVSSLAPGIYFVKVRGEKQERVGKFVKQ